MKREKKKSFLPSPFDVATYKTERTVVSVLVYWMREIIKDKNLDLGMPDVETTGADGKMPDAVIYESPRTEQVLCVIEAKLPYFDVFNEQELKEPARKKAVQRKAKYFATTNFKNLIWFNTEKVNAMLPDEEQIMDKYELSKIEDVNLIDQPRYSETIKKGLERFLVKLSAVKSGKEPEPKIAIDELLIYRLYEKIRILTSYYKDIIYNRSHKDNNFARELKKWFKDQGWNFAWQDNDFSKAARQTSYLLVNKILFYNALQSKRPNALDVLTIPDSLTKGASLQKTLDIYFDQVLKIDYETIYTTDFIDSAAFPDSEEVVNEIKELVKILKRYDFSRLGYDIIGRIFERLIPSAERHNLGQYFTSPDIVDIILSFCLKHEDSKVLDPSCGAGTFLVRAYQHKKMMNQSIKHEDILDTLWGVDIAKFPSHLATINLAINDLGIDKNYPNILNEDFFSLHISSGGFDPDNWRKRRAKTLNKDEREIIYPRWFDAIVGNPPYTRQEEIEEAGQDKEKLIESALYDLSGKRKLADISKRAGIHAYFFVHGMKFLTDGGYFGFIVASSWLDVEYGVELQKFLLEHFKLVTIIESKVERWFEEADINTCIVILQKCKNKKDRDDNLARFVYLKRPLRHFMPPAQDIWEKQLERLNAADKLKKTILAHADLYENEDFRVLAKSQSELAKETKWGKFLRAPEIYFEILKKHKRKFVKLKDVANIRRGFTTGVNEFFYPDEEALKKWKIEKRFLQPVIFSLKEIRGYKLNKNDLKRHVIICDKKKPQIKGTNLLKYIEWGEKQGFNKRETCSSRGINAWYIIAKDWKYAPLIFPSKIGGRMPVFLNDDVFEDKKLYGITPKRKSDTALLAALLNSTLTRFIIELNCRQLTGAQAIADIDVAVVEALPIINPANLTKSQRDKLIKSFKALAKTESDSILKEISSNPEDIKFDKIKPELRKLDKVIMEDILKLNEQEQIEVYKSVVDLVISRNAKADSIDDDNIAEEGVNTYEIKKDIVEHIIKED